MKAQYILLFSLLFGAQNSAQADEFGTPIKISHELLVGESISSRRFSFRDPTPYFEVSPDGKTLVYSTTKNGKVSALYATDILQGVSKKLSHELGAEESINQRVRFSADSKRLLYFTQIADSGKRNVYSASLSGGAPVFIDELANTRAVFNSHFSPDGKNIFYLNSTSASTENLMGLYKASSNGDSKVELKWSTSSVDSVSVVKLSANGQWLVYTLDTGHLYSLETVEDATPVLLSEPHPDYDFGRFTISEDSKFVSHEKQVDSVFIEPEVSEAEFSLTVYDIDGAGGELIQSRGVTGFGGIFSENSEFIAYLVGSNGGGLSTSDLHTYAIESKTNTRINTIFGVGTYINRYQISPNSQQVVYALAGNAFSNGLYSAAPDGSGTKLLSNAGINAFSDFIRGNTVVFSQSGSANRFSNSLTGGNLRNLGENFLELNDSNKMVIQSTGINGSTTLSARLLSGEDLTQLNLRPVTSSNRSSDQAVLFLKLILESNSIIYAGKYDNNDVIEIFSLNLDGIELDRTMCFPVKGKSGGQSTICI